MARPAFSSSDDSYVRDIFSRPVAGVPVKVFTARSGGTQVTDLVFVNPDGSFGSAVPSGVLVSDQDGLLPAFAGPDGGPTVLYPNIGIGGSRVALRADPTTGGGGGGGGTPDDGSVTSAKLAPALATTIAGKADASALPGTYAQLTAVVATVSANGALQIGKHNPVDASGGARAMTLANASAAGVITIVEKTDTSANPVMVMLNLRGTASSTLTLSFPNEALELLGKADGSWWPVAGHRTKGSLDSTYAARRLIDVKTKGAAGDINTDDSAAFNSAATDAGAARVVNTPLFGLNGIGQQTIVIPPGIYTVTSPGALMRDLGIPRTRGLTIRGAGRGVTTIVFSPTVVDSYLFDNQDDWFGLTVEDITFHSTVASASFMRSVSNGGAQDYQFNRCDWFGTWKYGFDLQGTNTNSEMSWTACHIGGAWNAFFYIGPTNTSDQFLNYNFFGCSVIQSAGNFVDVAKGGNINVWGGNFIHSGDGSARQTFFALRGGDHASGVMRLYVAGIRLEHRHPQSELIYSEWRRGNIAFENIDSGVYSQMTDADTVLRQAYFSSANDQHPAVSWRDSSLMGYHEYAYNSTNHTSSRAISYTSCDIANHADPQTFIKYTDMGSNSPAGSKPPVLFELCRGKANGSPNLTGYQYPFNTVLGWNVARNGPGKVRTINLSTWEGGLPSSSPGGEPVMVKLPLTARLLGIQFTKPAGGTSTSTTYTYTVTDGDGVAVATLDGSLGGQAWNTGFNVSLSDIDRDLATDNARTLTLTATVAERSAAGKCILTYVA